MGKAKIRTKLRGIKRTSAGIAKIVDIYLEDTSGANLIGIRVLKIGHSIQSGIYLDKNKTEPPFEYLRAFDNMFKTARETRDVLMIGGGGWSYPRHLLASHDRCSIDVVEADEAIVEIARNYFGLDELEDLFGESGQRRLRTFIDTGEHFLNQRFGNTRYDAIAIDCFSGTEFDSSIISQEFLHLAKLTLKPEGLLLINVVKQDDEDTIVSDTAIALRQFFVNSYAIYCRDDLFDQAENFMLIGTDQYVVFPDQIFNY